MSLPVKFQKGCFLQSQSPWPLCGADHLDDLYLLNNLPDFKQMLPWCAFVSPFKLPSVILPLLLLLALLTQITALITAFWQMPFKHTFSLWLVFPNFKQCSPTSDLIPFFILALLAFFFLAHWAGYRPKMLIFRSSTFCLQPLPNPVLPQNQRMWWFFPLSLSSQSNSGHIMHLISFVSALKYGRETHFPTWSCTSL